MFELNILIIICLLVLVLTIVQGLWKGAPYLPTSKKVIRHMLALAEVKPGELVVDLGSGDGRILVSAVEDFQARAEGVEITWFYYWWSKIKVTFKGLNTKIKISRTDIYDYNLKNADVVVMFLLQDTNQKIKTKLEQELKPGTRVVSHYFSFVGWPVKVHDKKNNLYLYQR